MGPWLFSRGKPIAEGTLTTTNSRQWGRGFSAAERRECYDHAHNQAMLQLGRGFSAAESTVRNGKNAGNRMLQLGRGFSAAESLCRAVSARDYRSFNWAAAFQPRKGPMRPQESMCQCPLQLGRGFSAAESTANLDFRANSVSLQLGRGFSAAESMQAANQLIPGHDASIGPRLFSRGKLPVLVGPKAHRYASIGPRLFSRGKRTTGHVHPST